MLLGDLEKKKLKKGELLPLFLQQITLKKVEMK